MTLQSDLDAIAAQQGKSIPSGQFIQGSESGWPDAALPGERFASNSTHDMDDDDVIDELDRIPTPSPLIPRKPVVQTIDVQESNWGLGETKPSDWVPDPNAPDPRGRYVGNKPTPENLENFRAPDLTIFGNDDAAYIAAYQGRQVELSGWEQAQVRKVVLTAIKRTIMTQLDEVDALLPKRKRKRAGGRLKPVGQHGDGQPGSQGGFVAPDAAESPAPRRRGRPRKVQ